MASCGRSSRPSRSRDESSVCVLVVRLWLEPSEEVERNQEWRGDVRHVRLGKTTYFRHQDGVVGAIRRLCSQLGEAAAD